MHDKLSLRFWSVSTGTIFFGLWGLLIYYFLMNFNPLKIFFPSVIGLIIGYFLTFIMPKWIIIRSSRVMNGNANSDEKAWSRQWALTSVMASFVLRGIIEVLDIKLPVWGIGAFSSMIIGLALSQIIFSLKNKRAILSNKPEKNLESKS